MQNWESASLPQVESRRKSEPERVSTASSTCFAVRKDSKQEDMGFRNVHTPGPAEKAGKSSKSIMNSADASPHEGAEVVAAVLEAVVVFEYKCDENP